MTGIYSIIMHYFFRINLKIPVPVNRKQVLIMKLVLLVVWKLYISCKYKREFFPGIANKGGIKGYSNIPIEHSQKLDT
jgi:hypothetical protein